MDAGINMATANSTMPDMGKPQSQARAWFEPLVCTLHALH